MYFDKECAFCEKTCYLLRYLLGLNATISPAQDDKQIGPILERENSWVVVDEQGVQRLRWEALVFVFQASSRFSWLAKPMQKAGAGGDRVYNWIGDRRYGFGSTDCTLDALAQDLSTYWYTQFSICRCSGCAAVLAEFILDQGLESGAWYRYRGYQRLPNSCPKIF